MKKITKLLTAFATAAALILGASAFVSCSNSSDDSTPYVPSLFERVSDAVETFFEYKKLDSADDDLSKAYNEAYDAVEKTDVIKEFSKINPEEDDDYKAAKSALDDASDAEAVKALEFEEVKDETLKAALAKKAGEISDDTADEDFEKYKDSILNIAYEAIEEKLIDELSEILTEDLVSDLEDKLADLEDAFGKLEKEQQEKAKSNTGDEE